MTEDSVSRPSYAERRAAMADETRSRILAACVQILGRGVTELSIPAVAREAGVSVPTVYRNFPDKKTLVRETAEYLKSLRGPVGAPQSLAEIPDVVRTQFARAASLDETVRTAIASEAIMEARRDAGEQQKRVDRTAAFLAEGLQGCSAHDRRHAVLITTALCSSAMMQTLRSLTGISTDEAADTVIWTIAKILGRDSLTTAPAKQRTAKGIKR